MKARRMSELKAAVAVTCATFVIGGGTWCHAAGGEAKTKAETAVKAEEADPAESISEAIRAAAEGQDFPQNLHLELQIWEWNDDEKSYVRKCGLRATPAEVLVMRDNEGSQPALRAPTKRFREICTAMAKENDIWRETSLLDYLVANAHEKTSAPLPKANESEIDKLVGNRGRTVKTIIGVIAGLDHHELYARSDLCARSTFDSISKIQQEMDRLRSESRRENPHTNTKEFQVKLKSLRDEQEAVRRPTQIPFASLLRTRRAMSADVAEHVLTLGAEGKPLPRDFRIRYESSDEGRPLTHYVFSPEALQLLKFEPVSPTTMWKKAGIEKEAEFHGMNDLCRMLLDHKFPDALLALTGPCRAEGAFNVIVEMDGFSIATPGGYSERIIDDGNRAGNNEIMKSVRNLAEKTF